MLNAEGLILKNIKNSFIIHLIWKYRFSSNTFQTHLISVKYVILSACIISSDLNRMVISLNTCDNSVILAILSILSAIPGPK